MITFDWQDLPHETSPHEPNPATETEVETELEGLEVDAPHVGIVMGSKSDMPAMEKAAEELDERGILHEVRVMSAHRDPEMVADYAKNARMRGLRVIIAGAGLSAALPGVVAAHTDLPVIGVPLTSTTSVAGGLDALLSIAQMPPGVPVACVGVDNARNAAVLAARILVRSSSVYDAFDDPDVALGPVAERGQRRLVGLAVVGGDRLLGAVPLDQRHALVHALLVDRRGHAARDERPAARSRAPAWRAPRTRPSCPDR